MFEMIIVDDEIEIRNALCNYFPWDELGFKVVGQFDNGKLALEHIRERSAPPQVVFSDIRMPVMTGIELAKALFEMKSAAKVIFLSGYADFEFAKQALVYGVKDYILKPAKYQELSEVFSRIRSELETAQAQAEADLPEARETRAYSYDEQVIDTIKQYIEKNYWQANLKEASALVSMNPSYLSNFFKLKTGENFSDYVLTQRMKNASEQLMDIHNKIYEVSDNVGYSNPKNFTRTFKNYYGVTPMEFRRGIENEN